MAINFSYKVLNEKDKQIEIIYNDRTLKFQLNVKRAFTLLKAILGVYPAFFSVHDLDNTYHDPNRAHSDLKLTDGFANFLIEKRGEKRVMLVKLEVDKLFNRFDTIDPDEFIMLAALYRRGTLTDAQKDEIYNKFNGKCNVTHFNLDKKLPVRHFLKSALLATYDHRMPIAKGGKDEIKNFQLVSRFVNDEKNKICITCRDGDCRYCALAYPEKYNKIQANGQSITELREV